MTRRPVVAGNWKMNTTLESGKALMSTAPAFDIPRR
jgi:triosephosphate isomerase